MRLNTRTFTVAAMLAILAACTAASVVTLIEDALTIALEAVAVTGVIPPQYQAYVEAALTGIECASTEAATNDTPQVKTVKITACFAGVAAPVLPPGTAQNIVAIVSKLAAAIQKILAGLPPSTVTAAAKPVTMTVTPEQKTKLLGMAKQAHGAREKLAGRAK